MMGSHSKIHYGWIIAAGGFITQIVLLMSQSILPIVLLVIEQDLGISHADVGLIVSVYSIFQIMGYITWGIVADRIGLRRSLTMSSLITSIGIICMGTINSLTTGLAAYALSAFGASALASLIPKLTKAWFETRRRGIASSIITSGGTTTMSLMGIIVPFLANGYGWRFPFLLLGAAGLFLSLISYALIRDNPKEKGLAPVGVSSNATEKRADFPVEASTKTTEIMAPEEQVKSGNLLKMTVTWHLGIMYAFFNIGSLCIQTYLVSYIMETGQNLVVAGSVSSVLALCSLLSQNICGILSDRVPRRYIVSIMGMLQAVFIGLFIILSKGLLTDYVMISLIGLSGGTIPVIWAMFSDYFNQKYAGTASGVIMSIGGLGSVVGAPVAGTLAVMTGTLATALRMGIVAQVGMTITALALKNPACPDNVA
jgi:sugar phosphate permease